MSMAKSTKPNKTTASKKTAAKPAQKTTPVSQTNKKTSSNQIHMTLMSLILVGVVLVLLFSSFAFYQVSQVNEKVTRLDNFFANNAQGYGTSDSDSQSPGSGDTQAQQPDTQNVGTPDIENRPVLGDADAPVTIVEYSDFTCGFCGKFHSETYPQLKEKYIDTGLVKFVYKDFPVVQGQDAAIASKCVFRDLGNEAFFEYHNIIFNNQNVVSESNLRTWAIDLGISGETYDACIEDQEIASQVQADFTEGQGFGISGTPGFIINGKLLVGAQPFAAFEQIIEAELE